MDWLLKWFERKRPSANTGEIRALAADRGVAAPEPSGTRHRLATLTNREREVFNLLTEGKKQREIAAILGVQPTTIGFHTTSLYRKLDVHDKAQLFLRYVVGPRGDGAP